MHILRKFQYQWGSKEKIKGELLDGFLWNMHYTDCGSKWVGLEKPGYVHEPEGVSFVRGRESVESEQLGHESALLG